MIILLFDGGLMGNKISMYAQAFVYGLEYQQDVYLPLMDVKLQSMFAFDFSHMGIRVSKKRSRVALFISKAMKAYKKMSGRDIAFKEHKIIKGKNNQINVICTWNSHNDRVLLKHIDKVRKAFRLNEEVVSKCAANIDVWKDKGNPAVVGVHLRRGDYKNFQGGKWYYSEEQYASWLKGLASELPGALFLAATNEKLDLDYYSSLGINLVHTGGNAIEDLCYLSLCDYIMGPPSTFSWWAGILGHVKRCELDSADKQYSTKDFLYFEESL